jgi:hypothetical protein
MMADDSGFSQMMVPRVEGGVSVALILPSDRTSQNVISSVQNRQGERAGFTVTKEGWFSYR